MAISVKIDLVHEELKERDRSGRFDNKFIVFELKRLQSQFYFLVGIEDVDTLDGSFISEEAGNADPQLHFEWSQRMQQFVSDYVLNESSELISPILTEAVRLFNYLFDRPEQWQTGRVFSGRTSADLSLIKRARSNPSIHVRMVSDNNWTLTIKAEYANIAASCRIYSGATGYSCLLRVLSPRLAIGRNVSFGGLVSAPGLMKRSQSQTVPALLDAIVKSLEDELPYAYHTYDYEDTEYQACLTLDKISTFPLQVFTVRSSEMATDSSVVYVNSDLFFHLLAEKEVLWLRLSNATLEKYTWVMANFSPTNIRRTEMLVPDTVLANLNCDPGDEIAVHSGQLELADDVGIAIRVRGDARDTQDVLDHIPSLSCLTVGSTYSVPSLNSYYETVYFDVLRAGSRGACSLRSGHAEINVELSTPLLGEPDNLRVDDYADDTDEESE
ncbi:Hypothetical protein POVR2_LOCUS24 [uncultured virus]|nr:Hypothetical protein POVR2_LOCUS24 [uncultured virus]